MSSFIGGDIQVHHLGNYWATKPRPQCVRLHLCLVSGPTVNEKGRVERIWQWKKFVGRYWDRESFTFIYFTFPFFGTIFLKAGEYFIRRFCTQAKSTFTLFSCCKHSHISPMINVKLIMCFWNEYKRITFFILNHRLEWWIISFDKVGELLGEYKPRSFSHSSGLFVWSFWSALSKQLYSTLVFVEWSRKH